MTEDTIRYDIWVEEALRSVIKKTLTHVHKYGLNGDHHFYITFMTQDEGVVIPGHIRAQHPIEMTIVLQHQFDDLSVEKDHFSVSLSFGGKKELLVIPYISVVSFADPSVNFALQLKMTAMDEDDDFDGDEMDLVDFPPALMDSLDASFVDSGKAVDTQDGDKKMGEVITLDAFRKK